MLKPIGQSPLFSRSRPVAACARVTALALAVAASIPAFTAGETTTIVPAGAVWRYLDNGSNQGTAWRARGFDDRQWNAGAAELGYGDGDEATVVGYGPNSSAKYITTYLRHAFDADPASIGSLTLHLQRDDGAVVYLNGTEVFRSNMPAGAVSYVTPALSAVAGADERAFVTAGVNPGLLVAGTNVLAVELHQASGTSSDISFDLQLLASSSVTVTRGPYLQMGTPSGTVVRWRTSAPVIGRVQYGLSAGAATWSAEETAPTMEHQLELTGLLPDTAYYYAIGTPDTVLAGGDATHLFRTPPATGASKPTRVWVVGDSGTADAGARAVRDAYDRFTGTRHTDLWLMLGDNAYERGTDAEYQAAVFDTYPEMLRRSVLWPTFGNHDGYSADSATQSGPYYEIFTLPKRGEAGGFASGTEAYYSFDWANIHFICLDSFDSSRSPAGAMLTWLRQDLASTNQPWVIVFFHHPPYSKGSHDSDSEIELIDMRRNVVPILEDAGVDLVLAGHSHSYERSFLIDGHHGDSTTFSQAMKKDGGSGREDGSGAYRKPTLGMAPHEGTVYAVAGSSGRATAAALGHPAMFVSLNSLGSMVLDIDGSRLDAIFLDHTGTRRDYFTIVKGSTGGGGTTPSPYGGTPVALPGIIQAENFDEGGAAVAYADSTSGNNGTVYRSTDVDIGAATDSGGGYYVGWTRPGEWLTYTASVAATGTYTLEARIANKGTGASFHIAVDGVDRTGPIALPDSGGWQAWTTLRRTGLPLTAGTRRISLVLDAGTSQNGGVGNYNFLRFTAESGTSTPFGGTPAPVPGRVEAEDFDEGGSRVAHFDVTAGNTGGSYRMTDVDIAAATDTGGGHYVGWTRAGEWLQYTLNVSATGSYGLQIRIANKGTGARFHLEVDGVDRTGPLTVPDTGGWQNWQTVTTSAVQLTAGVHVLRLVLDTGTAQNGGVGNYNYVRIVPL